MFTIGTRTFKTAIGMMASLVIAYGVGLENASTAAIITLLSVQSTKWQSVLIAFKRFIAGLAGIIIATILLEGTAFTPLMVGVICCIYLPLMAKLKLQDGIVPGFVIIMQLYVAGSITTGLIINEVYLIVIGIVVALIVNLYMPSTEYQLKDRTRETEDNMKYLLLQLSRFIRKKEPVWNDAFEQKTIHAIMEGQDLAKRQIENSFFRKESYYEQYYNMRRQQMDILQRSVHSILHLPTTFEQSGMVADFIEHVGITLAEDNPATELLDELRTMKQTFADMKLPETREEFETRAALLIFINEIERFIKLKTAFYEEVKRKWNKQK
ncbi:MAG: aromatic acid exporter family protein [Bacillus sp. (in: firmicutes)]